MLSPHFAWRKPKDVRKLAPPETIQLEAKTISPGRHRQDVLYSEANSIHGAAIRRLARGYEADPDKQRDLLQKFTSNSGRAFNRLTAAAVCRRGSIASLTT